MFRIYPYKAASRSAQALKRELGGLIIKPRNSRYRHRSNHTVINWGNPRMPDWLNGDILNHPSNVAVASNKLRAFETLQERGVKTVPFTVEPTVAEDWLVDGKVYARHVLNGHSGDGIEVVNPAPSHVSELDSIAHRLSELGYKDLADTVEIEKQIESPSVPEAPLYTKQVSNNGEYRVHVFKGEVIHYQKKCRRVERDEDGNVINRDEPNEEQTTVRNLGSGWVYRSEDLERLERVEQLALQAIEALGLDFGAVDIINDNERNVYVLEVNTAVGLGNQATLEAYVTAFNNLQ